MTFSLPERLAERLTKRVPTRERSKYVAEAIAERLAAREHRIILACETANAHPEVQRIERELDALPDSVAEPFVD